MRCFIAIDMPEKVREEIKKIQEEIPRVNMKKVKPEKTHLTLKFLGEIDENQLEKIKSKLNNLELSCFNIETSELGVFSPNFIKIVWLKLVNQDNKIKDLNNLIEEEIKDIVSKEDREFHPHVTLARINNLKGFDRREFLDRIKKISFKKHKFNVDRIILKKSILGRNGPEYSDLYVKDLN